MTGGEGARLLLGPLRVGNASFVTGKANAKELQADLGQEDAGPRPGKLGAARK